jgi:hypothetical protein
VYLVAKGHGNVVPFAFNRGGVVSSHGEWKNKEFPTSQNGQSSRLLIRHCVYSKGGGTKILATAQGHSSNASYWFRWRARAWPEERCNGPAPLVSSIVERRQAIVLLPLSDLKANLCTRCQRNSLGNHSGEDGS